MSKRLIDKVALITGAASGQGAAETALFVKEGAKVIATDVNTKLLNQHADNMREQYGDVILPLKLDVTQEDQWSAAIDKGVDKFGKIDILVNNYGSTDVKVDFDLLNGDTNSFFKIVENNLKSVYIPSKHAVKSMIQTGGGSIVNISSVGGRYPDLSRTAYGIAKAAINYLTENIAVQYARQGVRCNAVMPGFVATDAAMQNMSPEFLNMFLKNVPLNRPAVPEDIANAVLFFASDMSSFVTGETMPVAGGFGLPSPMYAMYQDMKSKG